MDTPDRDPRDRDPLEADRALARLRAALRGLDALADGADAVAPDASRVAGHLAGVGDADLLRDAAGHPAVRRLLSDVVSVSEAAEVDVRAGSAGAGLSPRVLTGALAAFDAETVRRPSRRGFGDPAASAAGSTPGGLGPRVGAASVGPVVRSVRRALWRTAAALLLLLVPLAVVSFVTGRAEAGPGVSLEGLDRVGADGSVATEGPRRLGVGATVSGLPGERLALRLSGGGCLVLPGEDVVRVACDDARCGRAVFALDRGEVLLAVLREGGVAQPVGLGLPSGDRFDLLSGAARLSREGGDRVHVVMRGDAVARWTPTKGAQRDLSGAATLVLEAGALRVEGDGRIGSGGGAARPDGGPSQRAAFRDLEFFGGVRRDPSLERRVGARRWRIVPDDAATSAAAPGPASAVAPRMRRSDGSGVPAVRMDLPVASRDAAGGSREAAAGGEPARLAWEPDESALLSRRLVVHLRGAVPPASGPTPASPSRVRVELEGVPGAFAEADLPGGTDPLPVLLEMTLPAGWAESRPSGADLVLAVTASVHPATVWFECAAFDLSEPSVPAARVPPGERAPGRRGE